MHGERICRVRRIGDAGGIFATFMIAENRVVMRVGEIKDGLHEPIDKLSEEQLPLVQKFISEISGKNYTPSVKEIWDELADRSDSTLRRLAQ